MRILIFLVMLFVGSISMAQLGIEASVHRGFLLPHHQNMMHLPNRQSDALEIRLYKKCNPSKNWAALYRQPMVGVTIRAIDLTNPQVLGYGFGAATFFSAPVALSKRFSWNLEMAAGLGYLTKKFEYKTNYKNIAIGSNVNAFIVLGQRFAYQVNNHFYLSAATSFNHFSNASYSLPNLGLNYPLMSFGGGWLFNEKDTLHNYTGDFKKVGTAWILSARFGIKESIKPRDKKCPVWVITGSKNWGVSRKTSIVSGFDVFYNGAIRTTDLAKGDTISIMNNIQLGAHFGYQLHVDEFTAMIIMGAYLIDNYKRDGVFYHRVGMRYFFSKNWGTQLSLKTHFFKADYFELGAVYRF